MPRFWELSHSSRAAQKWCLIFWDIQRWWWGWSGISLPFRTRWFVCNHKLKTLIAQNQVPDHPVSQLVSRQDEDDQESAYTSELWISLVWEKAQFDQLLFGDMETPQHGNNSTRNRIKNTRKPLKSRFFLDVSAISSNFLEIPLNSNFEEFSLFFDRFPKIVYQFPLCFIQIF